MDANQLAAEKVPGAIAPNRYIITKNESDGEKSFHVVTAGRNFKEFCRANKGSDLELHGLVMDKAKGIRMAPRLVPMGGSSFALLAPCSLRPSGHLRCASFALPSASVRMTQISNTEAIAPLPDDSLCETHPNNEMRALTLCGRNMG